MAEEFVEACRLLWDSWDDDAFIADKQAGRFVRPGSLHVPDFKGKYFTVEGGLNVPRPPQGHPVLIQAGSSGPRPGAGRAHRRRGVHGAERPGRGAGLLHGTEGAGGRLRPARRTTCWSCPACFPVIGRTEPEAQAIFAELNRNIDTAQAFTVLSDRLGTDMSVYPLDGPVPDLPETEHLKSRAALLLEMARREKLTPAPALPSGGGGARPSAADRHSGADRRRAGELVPRRRRRRLQRDAAVLSRPVRRLRRRGRADPAGARPVSRRL